MTATETSPQATPAEVKEYTVSELSLALKRTIEDAYGHVRVRGEIGRVSRPGSGHIYLDLKDEKSVLSAVVWRGTAGHLKITPEQGLEVVCSGRLTTFPGQSRYQIVIEHMELAGIGALMALLEERRRNLAAEGLFDQDRKKKLPFLPDVIGVVTSPTGAVIRDILHRLNDRFPRHVLLWPVLVQGQHAAGQIADAIKGFNKLKPSGSLPRPDLLIVARGGGSIEDLWAFNEEVVVRAAYASEIPLISAVGHETDTTLMDFAADMRAPTPTAAAEMAVPVRVELISSVHNHEIKLVRAQNRLIHERRVKLDHLVHRLLRLDTLLELPSQRLDTVAERLYGALRLYVQTRAAALASAGRVSMRPVQSLLDRGQARSRELGQRLASSIGRYLDRVDSHLDTASKLMNSYSFASVLERGFVLVKTPRGGLIRRAKETKPNAPVDLTFTDGMRRAWIAGTDGTTRVRPKAVKKMPESEGKKDDAELQGRLFERPWYND